MRQVKHTHCVCCKKIRVKHTVAKSGVCSSCKKHKDPHYFLNNDGLPVWYKNGDKTNPPQYHVPLELCNLTLAEKMLIQRVSPFVPLHHLKHGIMGLKGHVCAFEQDIKSMASVLPRSNQDVDILRIEQVVRAEIGSDVFQKKSFKVSRSRVITALYWLKTHNPEFMDIEIDEARLDWIGENDAGYLDVKTIIVEDQTTENETLNADQGPNMTAEEETENVMRSTGYIDHGGYAKLSADDSDINESLQSVVGASSNKKGINVSWPAISEQAVNEYSDTKIFARAFPWLFPGGLGDPIDYPQSIGDWGAQMLFYQDARFIVDKIFCFFALNYIIRHRNATSGRFFIDKFQKECPETLAGLKEQIENGNTSFVNSLTYYNKRVKGSNSYWAHKRSEVYTWINHHVECGNGAPMFFITLSCAEYYWADIEEIIKDRMEQAGLDSTSCKIGHPGFSQLVNDYSVVVQEYFQERVTTWLETVGKTIFGIEHYWVRYEFAPGRGQIHAHLLAISNDQDIYTVSHQAGKITEPDPGENRAEIIADWAKQKIGLTASVEPGFDDIDLNESQPTTIRFMDLRNDKDEHLKDDQRLKKAVQTHTCNGFCMRNGKKKK